MNADCRWLRCVPLCFVALGGSVLFVGPGCATRGGGGAGDQEGVENENQVDEDFTICDQAFTLDLEDELEEFEVRAGSEPARQRIPITLFTRTPTDRPSRGDLRLEDADVQVRPLDGRDAERLTGLISLRMALAGHRSQSPFEEGTVVGTFPISLDRGQATIENPTLALSSEALDWAVSGDFTLGVEASSSDVDAGVTISRATIVFGPAEEPTTDNENGDEGQAPAAGEAGGDCFPDGTCSEGLTCNPETNVCEAGPIFTISNKTYTFDLEDAGIFDVQTGQPALRSTLSVENLFETTQSPTDQPVSGDLVVEPANLQVTSLGVGKPVVPLQGISGSFNVTAYMDAVNEEDPCETGTDLGTIQATVANGVLSLDVTALALPPTALAEAISGSFGLCLEVGGDIDATVTITDMGIAFGPAATEGGEGEAECGNGVLEAGEMCDDAGESATCDADCTEAQCGDETLNVTAGEVCDDGDESAACDNDCTPAACGDGTVNPAAGEQCDDANTAPGDGCSDTCRVEVCGNGVIDSGEQCDDGGESANCNADCTTAVCGDGTVNATAGEQCDTIGEAADCDADCTFALCGDGTTNPAAGEVCDDGFATACGTCNADCSAAGSGSVCGDGAVCPETETCDDGFTDACGTCNADCSAAGSGSVCGDGVICPETETCDDGFTDTCGTCNADCSAAGSGSVCGDGVICPETEVCDFLGNIGCGGATPNCSPDSCTYCF